MPYTYEEFLSAKMPEIEENAFYRWWSNYKNIRKEEPEIVAKDAFDAGVSALMLVKQTLENDNAILRKRNADLEKKNKDLEGALTVTQNRYIPLQDKYIEARTILEEVLRRFVYPYSVSKADKECLERAKQFLEV